jgi:subtilisin family serine protease
MKRYLSLLLVLFLFIGARPAPAQLLSILSSPSSSQRYIVRSTGGLLSVLNLCSILGCQVQGGLDGSLGQLFLVTSTTNLLSSTVSLLEASLGIVSVELDQTLNIPRTAPLIPYAPSQLSLRTPINYYGTSVWYGYVYQPAAQIVRVPDAQTGFNVTGTGIVADIDTGVDPTHPALQGVLLQGYDFTRNQPGASELLDYYSPTAACSTCAPGYVNQSSMAIVDQSSMAIVDTAPYVAFGHGTEVVGIIHLVAPKAKILPLKAFHADGTGYLSDILRAMYYAVQNKTNVINMSFDFLSSSNELTKAVNYANSNSVILVASAGNDGKQESVYPASIKNVMGVASTSDFDTRSTFSNYGSQVVWVAAPGEQIVTTYPFGSYAAGSGTSFSAPFVSGGMALLLNYDHDLTPTEAAWAIAHAQLLTPDLVNGRIDLYRALLSLQ